MNDIETVIRQLMYEAADRAERATSHESDNYLWTQHDTLVFALSLFDVVPTYPPRQERWTGGFVPNGWEMRREGEPVRYFTLHGEERFRLENSDGAFLVNVHDRGDCAGEHCTIHNQSDHHMRSWPQHWRNDRGIIERICPHGVGHPDPDSPWDENSYQWVHGCDGCCREETKS